MLSSVASQGASEWASAGLMPIEIAVGCSVSSSVAIGCGRRAASQDGFRSPRTEVGTSASERVCSWNCTGQASARPEGLSTVARTAARAWVPAFGLRERSSRLSSCGGRKGGSPAAAVQSRRLHPLSGLDVWGLVLGVSASSRRYRCTTTLWTAWA